MSQLIALVSVSPLETVSSRFPGGPEIYSLLGMPSFILAAIFKVKMATASSGKTRKQPQKCNAFPRRAGDESEGLGLHESHPFLDLRPDDCANQAAPKRVGVLSHVSGLEPMKILRLAIKTPCSQ